MKHYAIAGGAEGKARLKILSQVMQPYTQSFFQRLGITTGMHCLDIGCGGGDVTFELANLVGEQGRVVGLELDETIVRLTQQDCQQLGLTNVRFLVADASPVHVPRTKLPGRRVKRHGDRFVGHNHRDNGLLLDWFSRHSEGAS